MDHIFFNKVIAAIWAKEREIEITAMPNIMANECASKCIKL